MQVFWSRSAKQDRYDIALYISQESVERLRPLYNFKAGGE